MLPLNAPIQNEPVNTLHGTAIHKKLNSTSYTMTIVNSSLYHTIEMFSQDACPVASTCWNRGCIANVLPSGCSTTNLMPFAKHRKMARASRAQNKFPRDTNLYPVFPRYWLNTSRPEVWHDLASCQHCQNNDAMFGVRKHQPQNAAKAHLREAVATIPKKT